MHFFDTVGVLTHTAGADGGLGYNAAAQLSTAQIQQVRQQRHQAHARKHRRVDSHGAARIVSSTPRPMLANPRRLLRHRLHAGPRELQHLI
jgi:hypothetical protein